MIYFLSWKEQKLTSLTQRPKGLILSSRLFGLINTGKQQYLCIMTLLFWNRLVTTLSKHQTFFSSFKIFLLHLFQRLLVRTPMILTIKKYLTLIRKVSEMSRTKSLTRPKKTKKRVCLAHLFVFLSFHEIFSSSFLTTKLKNIKT